MSALSVDVNLFDRDALFEQAVQEARELYGSLGVSATSVRAESLTETLREFKRESVRLPDMPEVQPLTEENLQKQGMALDYIRSQSKYFDFYSLRIPLTLFPRSGYTFDRVECQIDFSDGRPASERPLAHSIFPTTQYTDLATAKMNLDVGLNEKLEFAVAAKQSELDTGPAKLDASAQANIKTSGGLGFTLPAREYHVKEAHVVADGVGSSEVFWRLSDQKYVNEDRPQLSVVLKVPREANPPVNASGILVAYRSLNLWGADIRDVLKHFSEEVRAWFKNGTPVTARADWNLSSRL